MSDLSNEERRLPNLQLRQARLQRGWSQQQLADQLGTTTVTIKRWERGSQSPSPFFRLKLCAVLACEEAALGLCRQEHVKKATSTAQRESTQSTYSLPEERSASHGNEAATIEQIAPDTTDLGFPGPTSPLALVGNVAQERTSEGSIFPQHLPFRKSRWTPARWWFFLLIVVLFLTSVSLLSTYLLSLRGAAVSVSSPRAGETPFPLTVSNALAQQDPQSPWDTGKSCSFQAGAYHAQSLGVNYCLKSAMIFVDAAYQIEVTLVEGPQAGIVFRADGNSHLYTFLIDAQGHYEVDLINPPAPLQRLRFRASTALVKGYGQSNMLGVVSQGATMRFSINHYPVDTIESAVLAAGHVGICVGSYSSDPDQSQMTVATFRHVTIQGQAISPLP